MIIVLNNKSNLTLEEFNNYKNQICNINVNHKIILCPSYIYLDSDFNNILKGSQNVSEYEGQYTGEINAKQLNSLNVKYSIVGHSERKKYFNETNEIIIRKIKKLQANNIIPIICIGEMNKEDLENEINNQLKILDNIDTSNIIVAYEPCWAVGSDLTPDINEIEYIAKKIKGLVPNVKFLYGGSVDEKNIESLKSPLIDGYLLGRVSLDTDRLIKLINSI